MCPCLAILLTAAACAGGRSTREAPGSAGPIVAAVVRSDGVLVPFAVFEDGVWQAPDTEPTSGEARPSVTDRPRPWFADRLDRLADWRLVGPQGPADVTSIPENVSATDAPIEVATHCQRAWGLPIDMPGTAIADGEMHRNVGLAFSRSVPARPAVELNPTGSEQDRALSAIRSRFEVEEGLAIEHLAARGDWRVPKSGAAQAATPLGLTRLFRATVTRGTSIHAYEAARTYARPSSANDPGCDDAAVMTGWLAERPSGMVEVLTGELRLTDCDRKESVRVRPMAALELGEQTFVVTVDYGWEDEMYSIYEVGATSVSRVLAVSAGGC